MEEEDSQQQQPQEERRHDDAKRRKQPRSRSDRRAETQIKKQQRATDMSIPYACFKRLARETLNDDVPQAGDEPFKLSKQSVKMLQQSAEEMLVMHLTAARVASRHKGRRGIMDDDVLLVSDIQRVLAHKEPLHEKAEPASRRKRSRSRAKPAATTNKKTRQTNNNDDLERELAQLLEPIEEEEEEEEEAEDVREKEVEIEREPDSTDFQYEREEVSDMY